ncbi:PREDICTED: putative F-box only protein 9 [Camelina sativa]|uniref:F-box only protein 9 n=1 Tax=Camelina sativa TaxID=90675 RepID=A0ABM1QZX1_CAMSA|nr:PREDICTED: putative F-box only protein 9 [Camelina sativa]
MRISDVPAELLEDILSRLPTTSLKTIRFTCKRWNCLIKKNPRFLQASKQSLVLVLKEYKVWRMSVNHDVAAPSKEFDGALSLKDWRFDSEQVDIAAVFHCDGLLLCTTKDNRLVVWNPYLEQTKWIHLKTDHKRDSKFALGYQNTNKSCRSYKILRCWDGYEPNHHVSTVEIYEICSCSWRVLDNVPLDCFIEPNTGVSLKGNTYWLATDEKTDFLLRFDFTTERFKRFCLPPIQNHGKMVLSVVGEEQLLVLLQSYHKLDIEIWMADDDDIDSDAALLWSIYIKVDFKRLSTYFSFPVCWSFLIHEGKEKALCCTIGSYETSSNMVNITGLHDTYYAEIHDEDFTNWQRPIVFSYVPSLVEI